MFQHPQSFDVPAISPFVQQVGSYNSGKRPPLSHRPNPINETLNGTQTEASTYGLGVGRNEMKLDHIQLAMPKGEEEKARSFFTNVLGMVEDKKPYPLSERGGCWFRDGSVIIHVGVDKEFAPQKKAHPAFVVTNLNELERKLIEEGFEVVWDEALPDRTRFYSNDPFGNRIEFIKDGDGFTQK